METKDIIILAVTLLILGEVTYLLGRLPRTSIKAKDRAILVDTSVLMDGRIIGIASSGFIGGTLVIPRSVVGELQYLADNADADKRARARHGLDIVTELQAMVGVDVELLQDGSKANEGVDERLLKLAKQHHAVICTIDYNLNKVAVVEGIKVLNINELAQSLRMAHLPGEQMMLEVVQKGQDSHQGVAYLPDGTMVVVEQAGNMIGQSVHVEVVRSLQTAAGKMMFAKRLDIKNTNGNNGALRKPPVQVAAKSKSGGRREVAPATEVTAKPHVAPKQSNNRHHQNNYHSSNQNKQQHEPTRQTSRPPQRRSVDREAAMLDLVDKQ